MVASAKQLVATTLFASMLFFAPSLRADIVTVYNQTTLSGNWSGYSGNWGNSFQNTNSASTLKTVSLYLANQGTMDLITENIVYASGTLKLDVFAAAGGNGNWLPTGPSLGTATADKSFNGSQQLRDTYSFDFSSLNLNLASGGNYAFKANFVSLTNAKALAVYVESGSWYGQNAFNGSSLVGESLNAVVTVETTAVPEPGTLILTGSALLAGAIGVYFTRRHRDQALAPAAV
jgi:hypothetical protein